MEELAKKFESTLRKYSNILIFIKGSPDPDVIASSFALKSICDILGIRATISSPTELSLPQNKAFVKELDIPVKFEKNIHNPDKYDAYIITDHQSPAVENLTGKMPCAMHIDHHKSSDDETRVDFKLVSDDVGSASTLVSLLLKEMDIEIEDSLRSRIYTALLFGIQTDTDQYTHAVKKDYIALDFISKYSDNELINKISGIPLSEQAIHCLGEAIENKIIYKDWLIAGVGFLNEADRDSIAIIADFLLKIEEVSVIIVFAAIEKSNSRELVLDASLRTSKENINLNDIIKEITPYGGARKFKGAYQVDIDYFVHCPDKHILWEVLNLTTIEILKKRRDGIRITELKGFYRNLKKRFLDFWDGGEEKEA
ncbi:MAG: hypothetical protein GY754_11190 [bacterium]|nr:hypothetical protein [bacterium]